MIGHQPVDEERFATGLRVSSDHRMRKLRGRGVTEGALRRRIVPVVVDEVGLLAPATRFELGGQAVVGGPSVGEERVTASGGNLDGVEHRACGGILVVALIRMELHFAFGEDRLGVFQFDIRHHHDGGVPVDVVDGPHVLKGPEALCESSLGFDRKSLIP